MDSHDDQMRRRSSPILNPLESLVTHCTVYPPWRLCAHLVNYTVDARLGRRWSCLSTSKGPVRRGVGRPGVHSLSVAFDR